MKLLGIALALVIFGATWLGGHNVATAQEAQYDPCRFPVGTALQNEDGTLGQDLICISKPGVYYTNGVEAGESDHVYIVADDVTVYGERTKEGLPVEVAIRADQVPGLYVQSTGANTTVWGTTTYDYLVNYAGLPARLIGKEGADVIVEPLGTLTTSINAGPGADVIRTPARRGVVRGGPGRDTCKVRRTVKTYGCERIKRW